MTEPLASGSPSRKQSCSYDDAVSREGAEPATAPDASVSNAEPAEPDVRTVAAEEAIAKLPARDVDYSKMVRSTNSNQERTSARAGIAPYAAIGRTSSGDAFAGVAALKGREPKSGFELEMATVSLQRGTQSEAQIGVARLGGSTDRGKTSGTVDFATARVAGGIHNPDGSTGLNFAATATLLGVEATHEVGANGSVTGGAAFAVGGEVSLGVKGGANGKPALCFRFGAEPGMAGFCLEKPW
jgi:hypothetical protein